jgi:L-asparaginase
VSTAPPAELLPLVRVITTGGTIASRPTAGGFVATTPGADLLAAVPRLGEVARIQVEELFRIGSYQITVEQMLALAVRVRGAAREPGVAGVVVTHGTDTMEESAYLADLLYAGDAPVVFTGAQRGADVPDSDGPRNVLDAVRVAAAPAARGIGVVIAMGGRIDAARDATKVHTRALRAFGSPDHGPLGEITGDAVHLYRRRDRPDNLAALDAVEPRVVLIRLGAGMDGLLVHAACEAGQQGIVIECFGIGDANPPIAAAVERSTAAGVAVVVVSRCPAGDAAPVYGSGGGVDLARAGAIFGGNLRGPKARILLMAALAAARQSGRPLEELLAPHLYL